MNQLSKAYREHLRSLRNLATGGDTFAAQSLACIALLAEGWRYGDPDPSDSEAE